MFINSKNHFIDKYTLYGILFFCHFKNKNIILERFIRKNNPNGMFFSLINTNEMIIIKID